MIANQWSRYINYAIILVGAADDPPLQALLHPLLVISKAVAKINIVPYALTRQGMSTMLFSLQELLILFPFQTMLLPLQVVS